MPRCPLFAALLLLVLAPLARADDSTYEVRFFRPFAIGDRFTLDITEHHIIKSRPDAPSDAAERVVADVRVHLRGTLSIEGIDDLGRESRIHLAITELRQGDSTNDAPIPDVPAEVRVIYGDSKNEIS